MSPSPARPTGVDGLVERVVEVIVRTLDVPAEALPLRPDTRLLGSGLGVDSIDVLQLLAALEAELGIGIDDRDLTLANFETVGAIVGLLHDRLTRRP